MTPTQPAVPVDRRVLVVAPRGRDAPVIEQVLGLCNMTAHLCDGLVEFARRLDEGAGLGFITEEALNGEGLPAVLDVLARQPPWSDFPFVLLATRHPGPRSSAAQTTLRDLGNVVILERPLNVETLVSAASSAMRARSRQYQARRILEEQGRISRENALLYAAERLARQQASEAREALALAVDAAELGTFHCPLPLGRLEWNATKKAHFWLPLDAPVDMALFDKLVHPDDREAVRAAVDDAVHRGRPYDIEFRTVSPEGQWRWLRAKGRAYDDEQGKPVRLDGITIDVSRTKQLEQERETLLSAERAARQDAERASRMKDEFLATLSHELRTPLNAILGWTHLLRRRAAGPIDIDKGVDVIERNARAQARLIDDLLEMSRIISGKLRLELTRANLNAIIDAVLVAVQPAASAKGIRIDRRDPEPIEMMVDPHRLQQVLWNLLSNAVKFTPKGGVVTVEAQTRPGSVEIRVADSGVGIEPAFVDFVFDRFRQADSSAARLHGGLGLGLAIVRNLVELHGGTVRAESDGAGTGSVFTVRLPLKDREVAEPSEPGALDEPPGVDLTSAPEHDDIDLAGKRIVVVDDDPDGRDLVVRLLRERGALVYPAWSADEALTLVHREQPHLLISDIGMPRLDGYALLETLRSQQPPERRTPAIALTAFARAEDRARALRAGYATHLVKPVEPSQLLLAVARWVG